MLPISSCAGVWTGGTLSDSGVREDVRERHGRHGRRGCSGGGDGGAGGAGTALRRGAGRGHAAALPDRFAGGGRAGRGRDRGGGAAQHEHGVAGAAPLPHWWAGRRAAPTAAGVPGPDSHRVGRRTAPGHRDGPAGRGRGQRDVDDEAAGQLPGGGDGASLPYGDGATAPARRGLRLQASHVDPQAQGRGAAGVGGKRLRAETLLAVAASPPASPPPSLDALGACAALVRDLLPDPLVAEWVPDDLPRLLALLPGADLYLQDEVEVALHPTLSRVWCARGRRGQRRVEAPGKNDKRYGFGLVDWREGWFDWALEAGRRAAPFCAQLRRALALHQTPPDRRRA